MLRDVPSRWFSNGLPVDGGYHKLQQSTRARVPKLTGGEANPFDGKYLEELGGKPMSRVSRSVTPEDKEAVRNAAAELRKEIAQKPMGSTNLANCISHCVLADRFTPSQSVYILSLLVADKNRSYDEKPRLLNEREEEDSELRHDAMVESGSLMEVTDFLCRDMPPD
jgi:hypothetical protein